MSKFRYFLLLLFVSTVVNYIILWYQESYDLLAWINSTFFTGAFILGPGLLIFVANSGALGTITFFVQKGILILIRHPKRHEMNFYIYQAMRNIVPPYSYLFMFIIGGSNIAVMFILLGIYYVQ